MAASPEQPSLTVLGGPLSGQRLLFDQTVVGAVIGADASCSFRIDAPGVSPIHARVRYEDGGLIVFDTQSPRGLYINDDRVESQAALRNGDILWLGKPGEEGVVMIQCRIPSRPAAPAVAAATPEPPASTGINASSPAVVLDADMVDTVIEPNIETSTGADAFFGDGDADATVSSHDANSIETRAIPPSARRYDDDELPRTLHVEPPPRPPTASDFEDETAEAAAPAEPELPPTVIHVAAPTIAMPPPPALRVTTPTPVPQPAARPIPSPAAYPPPRPASSPKPKAPAVAKPRPSRSGGGGAGKIIAAVAAVVVLGGGAVGAFLFWKSRSGPGTPPHGVPTAATVATPAAVTPVNAAPTSATAEPAVSNSPEPIEEVVTVVSKTPPPAPRASQQVASATQVQPSVKPRPAGGAVTAAPPTAPPAAAQAAALKAQAEAAFAAGQYDAAIAHYDDAQKLAPSDELLVGKTRAQVARDSMRRRFTAGVTTASGKAAGGSISGFESSDVKVAKALDYSGRIEFEVTPEHVRPGVNYTIKILLTNDGKKKWQVSGVTGTTVANGQRAANAVPSSAREIEPQAKVALGEISGVWPEGVNSWYLELVVSSSRGDSFKSLLTWK